MTQTQTHTHSKVQRDYLKRHPISLNTDLANDEKIRCVIYLDLFSSLNMIRVIKVRKKKCVEIQHEVCTEDDIV